MSQAPQPAREVFNRWQEYLNADPLTCPHNPLQGTEPCFWYPGGLGIMCVECMGSESHRIAGTPFDYTCDLCGRVWEPGQMMNQDSITLKGKVLEDGTVTPVVVLVYAHCLLEPCQEVTA